MKTKKHLKLGSAAWYEHKNNTAKLRMRRWRKKLRLTRRAEKRNEATLRLRNGASKTGRKTAQRRGPAGETLPGLSVP
jgi:hypothetical protein